MELKPEEITKIIKAQIKNYSKQIEESETGTVILVGDGIARASGLEKCLMNELIEFPNGEYGMAQNLEENSVSIVILGRDSGIREGDAKKIDGALRSMKCAGHVDIIAEARKEAHRFFEYEIDF